MKLWQWLRSLFRPRYRLHVRLDSIQGKETVVLLHGIAASGEVWRSTYEQLKSNYRVIVVDLLGFGDSPKPTSSHYTADDHVRAVHLTLRRLGVRRVYVVGHSMGAIITLRYAVTHPWNIQGIVCVSMPAYDSSGGKAKTLIRHRTTAYIRLYEAMIAHPEATWSITQALIRGLGAKSGLKLDKESLVPFQKSLRNTIIEQNSLSELHTVQVPTALVYGTLDMFLIADHYQSKLFANQNVTVARVRGTHMLEGILADTAVDELRKMIEKVN